jgi:hypothetical protein
MNYYNYFTEIEERFQQRRGSLLMLSTLDWALIETWREAGVPLEAVLRGIDAAFDKHDAQRLRSARRPRKVNGLAWCAQAVLEAVEQSREASIGMGMAMGSAPAADSASQAARDSGFEAARVARYLQHNAAALLRAAANLPQPARTAAAETADRLTALATDLVSQNLSSRSAAEGSAFPSAAAPSLEDTDRTLTILEEKLFAALLTATPEDQLTALRAQADRELTPYRGKMQAVQIKQVQQQFLQKRLLEAHALPRLSLFYMPHEDDEAEA